MFINVISMSTGSASDIWYPFFLSCGTVTTKELQVRSLMGQVRPDRQTLLFTATMPTKVDNLVRDCLTTPVRITVGEIGAANQDIKQVVASILHVHVSVTKPVAMGLFV